MFCANFRESENSYFIKLGDISVLVCSACDKHCYDCRCRLQVFRTEGRGWGVRTLLDIPRGTFVCE